MAYSSNETGREDVFVRPFPDVDAAKVQISTNGGSDPRWSRDGQELFYVAGGRNLTAVSFDTNSDFRVTSQQTLFQIPAEYVIGSGTNTIDVAADSERFLMGRSLPDEGDAVAGPRLVLVHNFSEELRRRVPR
jgi:serine/threonine-protein kinase